MTKSCPYALITLKGALSIWSCYFLQGAAVLDSFWNFWGGELGLLGSRDCYVLSEQCGRLMQLTPVKGVRSWQI